MRGRLRRFARTFVTASGLYTPLNTLKPVAVDISEYEKLDGCVT